MAAQRYLHLCFYYPNFPSLKTLPNFLLNKKNKKNTSKKGHIESLSAVKTPNITQSQPAVAKSSYFLVTPFTIQFGCITTLTTSACYTLPSPHFAPETVFFLLARVFKNEFRLRNIFIAILLTSFMWHIGDSFNLDSGPRIEISFLSTNNSLPAQICCEITIKISWT